MQIRNIQLDANKCIKTDERNFLDNRFFFGFFIAKYYYEFRKTVVQILFTVYVDQVVVVVVVLVVEVVVEVYEHSYFNYLPRH